MVDIDSPPFADYLARHLLSHSAQTLRSLQHRFPTVCPAEAEDALQNTWVDVMRNPHSLESTLWHRGEPAFRRALHTVLWRQMRALWRRRKPIPVDNDAVQDWAIDWDTPEELLRAKELRIEIDMLKDAAAITFGGSKPEALRAALDSRLDDGLSDTAVANIYGLRRETVNRAKRWVLQQVASPSENNEI